MPVTDASEFDHDTPPTVTHGPRLKTEVATSVDWYTDAPGFEMIDLYRDERTGDYTSLMVVRPGASAGTHSHDQTEHIYVLDGTFEDEYGSYRAGDYLVRRPGSRHLTRSPEGSTVLLVYTRP